MSTRPDGGLTIAIEVIRFIPQGHPAGWSFLEDMLRPATCGHSVIRNEMKPSNILALPKAFHELRSEISLAAPHLAESILDLRTGTSANRQAIEFYLRDQGSNGTRTNWFWTIRLTIFLRAALQSGVWRPSDTLGRYLESLSMLRRKGGACPI